LNKILDALRTPSAMLVALLLALVAQLEHTAQVFSQVVNAQGAYATVHAYAFAIAVETAVLLFVLHEHRRISYMFAVATFATNLSYYAMHSVDLLGIAGAPAWLMAGLLPACIVGYSHVIAQPTQPATPDATPAKAPARHWRFWRKPVEIAPTLNGATSTTQEPVALPVGTLTAQDATDAAAQPAAEAPKTTPAPALVMRKVGNVTVNATDTELAAQLGITRQAVAGMRRRGTLTARIARDLPQPEPAHSNGYHA